MRCHERPTFVWLRAPFTGVATLTITTIAMRPVVERHAEARHTHFEHGPSAEGQRKHGLHHRRMTRREIEVHPPVHGDDGTEGHLLPGRAPQVHHSRVGREPNLPTTALQALGPVDALPVEDET